MQLYKLYISKIALHSVFFTVVFFLGIKTYFFIGSSLLLILFNIVPLTYTIQKNKTKSTYYMPDTLFWLLNAIEFGLQVITNIFIHNDSFNPYVTLMCLLNILLCCMLNFFRNKKIKVAKKSYRKQENKRMLGSVILDGKFVLKKGENVQLLNVFDDQALIRKFDGEEYLIGIAMIDSADKSESSTTSSAK